MRKVLILVATPFLLVIAGFAVVLFLDDAPLTPGAPVCGVSFDTDIAIALGAAAAENKWQVYSFGGASEEPLILTTERNFDDLPVSSLNQGCELAIRSLPAETEGGADWRIGFALPSVENLRGKFIKTRFFLKAEQVARLGTGSVYVYDGEKVVSLAAPKIEKEWGEYVITHQIPDDAEKFEFWFRLLFGKATVIPAQNTIQIAARIETTDVAAKPSSPTGIVDNGLTSAQCPLVLNGEGLTAPSVGDWQIYRFEATEIPDVLVAPQSSRARSEDPAAWCELNVTNAPNIPGQAIDWRMGHEFDIAKLRGKKILFSARMRASDVTKLSSARIYTYDGESVVETLVPELSENWETFNLTTEVAENASVFETWFRLIFDDGTIAPSDVKISFAPEVTVLGE